MGGGVRQVLTMDDKGGGGLAYAEITEKCLKLQGNMDFYPTHQDIIIIFVK